jgi:hypothetical protein
MSTIPQKNIPIYLQKYTVGIFCRFLDTVCPTTPIIGGCAGTVYGCCPDGITSKQDETGTNCHPQC